MKSGNEEKSHMVKGREEMKYEPEDLNQILSNLENGPHLLKHLLAKVPTNLLMENRIIGKWCIHAHACHVVDVQPMFISRLERFIAEKNPIFEPFIPDTESGELPLLEMNLVETVDIFPTYRSKLIDKIKSAPSEIWSKTASHPEYSEYTASIMIRHIMMHDFLHMYRIEELWLTKSQFLRS